LVIGITKQMFEFGIDTFIKEKRLIKERIALLSNRNAINKKYECSLDILCDKYNLSALFAPEHGFYGINEAGESVNKTIDLKTGLTIFSLYQDGKFDFTEEMLKTFDILIFDIQDLGLRFYTYISTLKIIIQTLAKAKKKLIILDRPLILGGNVIEGNILDEKSSSFVGPANLPIRYGLTIGELGLFFNKEQNLGCVIEIVKMKGWKRNLYFNELDRAWIKPSPAITSFETAYLYCGTCLFEGTNLSEGRGTYNPFEIIGAPFIKAKVLSKDINNLKIEGIVTTPYIFKPHFDKYCNQVCEGIFLHITNYKTFRPVTFALKTLNYLKENYPEFELEKKPTNVSHTKKLLGNNFEKDLNSLGIKKLLNNYKESLDIYKLEKKKYHLY